MGRKQDVGSNVMQYASHQQTNHYAVVGDMAIRFYLILLKRNRALSRTRNRVSYASVFLKTHGVLILTRNKRFLRFIVTRYVCGFVPKLACIYPQAFL